MTGHISPPPSGHLNSRLRIAYIISAYKQASLVTRLVRRLHAPDHAFFIHYDLRSPQKEYEKMVEALKDLPNVKMLSRHNCYWGDFGHVLASLKGIEEIAKGGYTYDYTVLLTAQDYPLRSDSEIRQRLQDASGKSFIEAAGWPIAKWEGGNGIKRIKNYYIRLPVPGWARSLGWHPFWQRIAIPLNRKIPGNLRPFFGNGYWYLHRSCIKTIQEYVTEHPEYVRFFHHSTIPDECFFQTILMNSKVAPTINQYTLTDVIWRAPWPGIITAQDLPYLLGNNCLFARKFDPAAAPEALDELDALIDAKAKPQA